MENIITDHMCDVCEQQPAAIQARFHGCAVCYACAASEPYPDEDDV